MPEPNRPAAPAAYELQHGAKPVSSLRLPHWHKRKAKQYGGGKFGYGVQVAIEHMVATMDPRNLRRYDMNVLKLLPLMTKATEMGLTTEIVTAMKCLGAVGSALTSEQQAAVIAKLKDVPAFLETQRGKEAVQLFAEELLASGSNDKPA